MREERACKARLLRTVEAELLAAVVGSDRLAQALARPAPAPPEERKDDAHLGDDGEDLRQLGHVLQLQREHVRPAAGRRDPAEALGEQLPRGLSQRAGEGE